MGEIDCVGDLGGESGSDQPAAAERVLPEGGASSGNAAVGGYFVAGVPRTRPILLSGTATFLVYCATFVSPCQEHQPFLTSPRQPWKTWDHALPFVCRVAFSIGSRDGSHCSSFPSKVGAAVPGIRRVQ